MKTKVGLLIMAAGFLGLGAAYGQEMGTEQQSVVRPWKATDEYAPGMQSQDAGASAFNVIGELRLTTKYVFRGVQFQDFSVQPSVFVSHESGAYGGVFANAPTSHGTETECDLFAGYQFGNEKLVGDVGGTLYFLPDEDIRGARQTFEAHAGVRYIPVKNLSTALFGYYDFNYEAWTGEVSAAYAIMLDEAGHSYMPAYLNLSVYAGYSSGNDTIHGMGIGKVEDSYAYYGVSVEVPVRLTKRLTSNIGVQYGFADGFHGMGREHHLWAFASLSYDFVK